MSYTYGFFDAVDLGSGNYDRVYSSAEFSHYWALLVGDGVFGQPSTSLNVLATAPVAMSVKVSPGTGWIKGHYLTVPDNMDEVIAVPVANPSLPRIDSIIMALDNTDRMMKLYVRSGTAAVSPTAVALQRDVDIWELELAQITVAAGAGNITQQAIKDMRTDPNRCGIVTGLIDQFDVSGFLTAAQASFDEWFEDVQSQLGDDVAGNLLNLINEMKNPDSPGSLQNQINSLESSKLGMSDKASLSQAQGGTDDTKWMTPSKVKSLMVAQPQTVLGTYTGNSIVTDQYKDPTPQFINLGFTPKQVTIANATLGDYGRIVGPCTVTPGKPFVKQLSDITATMFEIVTNGFKVKSWKYTANGGFDWEFNTPGVQYQYEALAY